MSNTTFPLMKSLKDIRENQAKKIANKALTKPLKIFCLQTMTDTELYYVQNIIVNTQLLLLLFFEHFEKNIRSTHTNHKHYFHTKQN